MPRIHISIIILVISQLFLSSCNSDEALLKKFYLRVNANEINASSKYIWPRDHEKLYIFNLLYLTDNPLVNFEILESESFKRDGKKFLKAKVKCVNCTEELKTYFKSRGHGNGEIISDSFEVLTANNQKYISFNWDWDSTIIPRKIKLATVNTENLNLRNGPGLNYNIISTKKMNEEILIDADYQNPNWRRGIGFNNTGSPSFVFFSSELSNTKEISFFTLSYFASFSITMILFIGIICWMLVYPIAFVGSFRIIGKSRNSAGTMALILFSLILGSLFFSYQILEIFLFEMFLVNLPL